ncbi:hypothetical protein AAC03nite_38250 [Alicyclobacillus acidoterrestris]|nr:hypothetical protein AAC03nite_38250 [Alicyclobacillus acidoterrestris]
MDAFIMKLGESKAEKLQKEFTQIHNDTAYQIIREAGSDGFSMYFTLNSLTFGKQTVITTAENKELQELIGCSESTVQRWIRKLEANNIVRRVPCFNADGMQEPNVILFNASYPEVPTEWDTFAPNGFIKFTDDKGNPTILLKEVYAELTARQQAKAERKAKMERLRKQFTKSAKSKTVDGVDRSDRLGVSDVTTLGVSDVTTLGVSDVTTLKNAQNPRGTRGFSMPQNGQDIIKTTNKTNITTVTQTVAQRDSRYANFYQLFPDA